MAMDVLASKNRRGVVWPLQSFSKNNSIDLKNVPMCVESEESSDLVILKDLFGKISEKVVEVSTDKRERLHVAAVFVNNFVNHLYAISQEIAEDTQLDFELLKPLLIQTANKMQNRNPKEVQTGPAKRNDLKTIQKHLHLLKDTPYQEVYKVLTEGIQKMSSDK